MANSTKLCLRTTLALLFFSTSSVWALATDPPFEVRKTTLDVEIDGVLESGEWADAEPIENWFETRPGDSLPSKLRNVGYLQYDSQFLYAAFEFADPDPSKIRALSNRDNVLS